MRLSAAEAAFLALDLADRLIERGYGTDVPREWHDAYKRVVKARAKEGFSLADQAQKEGE